MNLQVGRPVVTTHEYRLKLRVQLHETYGILLRMEKGQGAVVIFFNTSVVTQAALDTIKRELGNVPYDIKRKTRDGKVVYEVDAWIEGRHIELNIFADGKLRNKYKEVDLEALPDAVRRTISENLKGANTEEVGKIATGGTVTYQIEAEHGKKDITLKVAKDGKVISKEEDD